MATRKQVREAFYGELETAASGLVSPSNIGQENPESDEDLPSIVHNDNYRQVPMNRGAAPVDIQTGANGVEARIYVEMMQARFDVTIISDDEAEKEDIYEAVRTHFGAYTKPFQDATSIQSDVHRVEVGDSSSNDQTSREPVARADTLVINLGFQRFYTEDTTPIEEVNEAVDLDGDDIADITYTTT